jgi:signal transduction histidine kinase
VSINEVESAYEICVNDNGTGISTDALLKILDPFFTTKPDGTGLGLAITKKIIESHGGTLTVASELGKGTSVTVKLPLQGGGN